MKKSLLCLVVAIMLTAVFTTAEEFSVGTQGAVLQLDDSWERRQISMDLGPDQFVSRRNFFCFVSEYHGLYDGKEDLERLLATIIDGLPSTLEVVQEKTPTWDIGDDGLIRVTRRLTVRMSGIKLAYQFDVVGRDGLVYLLMTWAAASSETDLYDWASRAARGLTMPPPESEWGLKSVPTKHTMRFGRRILEIAYRDSMIIEEEEDDGSGMSTLMTVDNELAVHMVLMEDDGTLDAHLDDVLGYLNEGAAVASETERSVIETEAGRGRQVRTEFTDLDGMAYIVALGAISVADGLILDIRMVVLASAWCAEREALWSDLLSSIRVSEGSEVDAFPQAQPKNGAVRALNDAALAILEGSDVLGESDGWSTVYFSAPDNRLFAHERSRIVVPAAGDAAEQVVADGFDSPATQVLDWWADELVTLDGEGNVVAVRDYEMVPVGAKAGRFAVIDDDRLLLVHRPEAPEVFGFEYLATVQPTELAVYNRTGDLETIVNLGGQMVQRLAVSADGLTALLATRPMPSLGSANPTDTMTTLDLLNLVALESSHIAHWSTVSGLRASPSGWLVSGSPTDGSSGLYLISNTGEATLLISGDVQGVSLRDGRIRFATNLQLSDGDDDLPVSTVYESPIDLIREYGPLCRPFTVETVNLIAEKISSSSPVVRTAEDSRAYLEAADAVSLRVAGVRLPVEAAAFDRLVNELSYQPDLSADAVALLSVMAGEALMRRGAGWVDGQSEADFPPSWMNGWVAESPFAVAIEPRQVVVNTLRSEDGWWSPVTSILDSAAGRTILVGRNLASLESRLDDESATDAKATIETAKTKKIRKLFLDHPDNTYLRSQAYRHLAAGSRFEIMETLADSIIRSGEPDFCDWRAWAAARYQLADGGADPELDISRLREAIGKNADKPSLYLLLGAAYERSDRTDRADLARACYLRVLDLRTWGDLQKSAQEGLDRLDEN